MKHLFKSLSRFFLLACLLLGGISQAWGAEETLASFSNSSQSGWAIANSPTYGSSSGYQLTANNKTITSPEIDFIKYEGVSITITCRKYNGPNATQGKISVKEGSTSGTELVTYSPSGTKLVSSGKLSISPSSKSKLVIYCPGASDSKGCGISEIVIKGTLKSGDNPDPTPDPDPDPTPDPSVDYATLPFSYSGDDGKDGIANVAGMSANGLGTNYAEQNAPYRLKFDDAGDYVVVKLNAQPGVCTFGVKKIGGTKNSTFEVQGSIDGTDYSDVQTFSTTGSNSDEHEFTTTNSFAEGTRYVKIMMSVKGANVGLGTISITAASSPSSTTLNVEGVTNNTISFSSIEREQSANKTFTLSGSNLTADASLAITGTNAAMFRVSPNSVTPSDGSIPNTSITVTYAPTAIGSHSATLTISTDGTDPKIIALTGSATAPAILYGITCAAPESGCSYTVKIGDAAAETITAADSKEALEGKTITLTTTAGPGYVLASDPFTITHESGSFKPSKNGNNYTFEMPAYAVTITANYSKTYTLTAGDCENGEITAFKNNNTDVTEISYRSKVVVEYEADGHYHITGMYYIKDNDETQNEIDKVAGVYSLNKPQSNVTVFATFAEDTKYTINYFINGIVVSSQTNVYADTQLSFPEVTAPEGKSFRGWVDAAIIGTIDDEPNYVSTTGVVSGDKDYYAVFATQSGEGNPNILKSVSGTITSGDYYLVDTYDGVDYQGNAAPHFWAMNGGLNASNGTSGGFTAKNVSSYAVEENNSLTLDLTNLSENDWPTLYTITISDDGVSISRGEETYYCQGTNVSADLKTAYQSDYYIWSRISEGQGVNANRYSIEVDHGTGERCLLFYDHTASKNNNRTFKNQYRTNRGVGGAKIDEASFGSGYFYFLQAGSASYSGFCTSVTTTPEIGNGGWSTLCLDYNYTISNATAYIATDVDLSQNKIVLTPLAENTIIPARAGIAIQATANYTITPKTGAAAELSDNLFEGFYVRTPKNNAFDWYGISTNNEGVTGFARASDKVTHLPAGKAFLKVSPGAPARLDMTILNPNNPPITTGVEQITLSEGKKMLVRGQLVIVRGNKMFDMNGRLVK